MDRKRAILVASVGLGLAFVLVATGALADQEPNDDFANAEQMPSGTVTGTLTYDTDESDYYEFTVSEGQRIDVTFESDTGQDFLYGYLSDWDEWTIMELKSKDSVAASGTYHTCNETAEATWYFYVESDTEGGGYEFTVTLTDQDDGGLGKDAGGAMDLADPIVAGTTVTGVLADADEEDWYRFKAGEGDIINVSLTSDSDADFIYMDLVDWEDWTIFTLESKDSVMAQDEWYTALETGSVYWYLRVQMDTDMGTYDLALEVGHQADAGTQTEAPGDTATAMELASGTWAGHLEDEDEADCYKFEMGEGDRVHVTFSADAAGDFIYVKLIDWEDYTLWSLDSKASEEVEGWYWTAHETETAWYYLAVEMDTAPGDYELVLDVEAQDDADEGRDAGEDAAGAIDLEEGAMVAGRLQDLDEVDAYNLHVAPGDVLHIYFNSTSVADQSLLLTDSAGGTALTLKSSQGTAVEDELWTANETEGGTWMVAVDMSDDPSEAYGAYYLKVTVTHQDDAGSGEDLPGTDVEGLVVQAGTYSSALGGRDDADAYRIAVEEGWKVTITLTSQGESEAGVIGDTGVAPLETISSKDGAQATWEGIIDIPTAADGYLYVVVSPKNVATWEPGSYQVVVAVTTDGVPPQIVMDTEPEKIEEGKAMTLSITATDNEDIDKVTLYYKIDDDPTWNEVAMTSDGDTWSGTIPEDATLEAVQVDYVIIAWDTAGNNVTYGDFQNPKSMEVTKPPKDDDGPGFGALLAVAALTVLAAGLADRRRNAR